MSSQGGLGAPDWGLAVFVTCGAILLALAAALARAACQRSIDRKTSSCQTAPRAPLCGRCCSSAPKVDEVHRLVDEKMNEEKVEQFKKVSHCFCYAFSVGGVVLMWNIALDIPRAFTMAQDVVYVAILGISSITVIRPATVTCKTVDVFYAAYMLCFCASVTPLTCQKEMMSSLIILLDFAVLTLCGVRPFVSIRRTPAIFFCNVLFVVCSCSILIKFGETCCFVVPGTASYLLLSFSQSCTVMGGMMVSSLLHRGAQKLVSFSLQLQETKELHSAACALLRSCCEVVVELDSDGVIIDPAADLGSFLLRGPGQNLQGTRLVDIISEEEDKQHFLEKLGDPKLREVGLAENLPVRARDGNGNILHLELLWFQYRRLHGQTQYMVGVREHGDNMFSEVQRREMVGRMTSMSPPPNLPPKYVEPLSLSPKNHDPWMNDDGFALPEMLASDSGSETLEAPAAIAVVDSTEAGFPLRSFTSGFCVRIGRLPLDVPISRYIKKPDNLTRGVQESINSLVNETTPASFQLTFTMPQGEVKALCRVRISVPHEDDDSLETGSQTNVLGFDLTSICLHFDQIRLSQSNGDRDLSQRRPLTMRGTPCTSSSPSNRGSRQSIQSASHQSL